MATVIKKSFLLVNDVGQEPLDIVFGDSDSQTYRYTDWDLDSNGNIRRVQQQEQMILVALKCIFTERQISGYGSNIYNNVGTKDEGAKRLSLFVDLNMAIASLKAFTDAVARIQNLNPEDLISSIGSLTVSPDQSERGTTKIRLNLVTNQGSQVELSVL